MPTQAKNNLTGTGRYLRLLFTHNELDSAKLFPINEAISLKPVVSEAEAQICRSTRRSDINSLFSTIHLILFFQHLNIDIISCFFGLRSPLGVFNIQRSTRLTDPGLIRSNHRHNE
ncbi:hypothetical protein BLNAU_19023 [Blattamonas nauphoetae]|uniref:Transposase n=1 Tax=Blattamonas nauphoetae TaxID=2049346 RepID=A0ABQ9X2S0_9EUKA|nr:hypothetical protein BLNAU_19023 [Blattamonas nauphoetae]